MKKKILVGLLVFVALFTITGCGNSKKEESNSNSSTTKQETKNNDTKKNKDDVLLTEEYVRNYKEAPATDFEYKVNDKIAYITKYIGNDDIIVIPEKIEGKPVADMDRYIFNRIPVRAIKYPSGITKLDYPGFCYQGKIEIVLAESVVEVEGAFLNPQKLRIIDLGNKLEKFEAYFNGATKLEKIHMPSTVTEESYYFLQTGKFDNLTIVGEKGSLAEQKANEFGYKFEAEK